MEGIAQRTRSQYRTSSLEAEQQSKQSRLLQKADRLMCKDPDEAQELYRQLADAGCAEACYRYAIMLSDAHGTEPNPHLAYKYLKTALKHESELVDRPGALRRLSELEEQITNLDGPELKTEITPINIRSGIEKKTPKKETSKKETPVKCEFSKQSDPKPRTEIDSGNSKKRPLESPIQSESKRQRIVTMDEIKREISKQAPPEVEKFFRDLDPQKKKIALALRQEIRQQAHQQKEIVMEGMKYGGVLYYLGTESFCGIFSYKAHVTLEFGRGNELRDPAGRLEGSGKFRRNLKFKQLSDVGAKQPQTYIKQAIALQGK